MIEPHARPINLICLVSLLLLAASPGARAAAPKVAAPGNLTAVALPTNQIRVTWVDNSSNESQFYLERSTNNFAQAAQTILNANVTNYTDTGLAGDTPYAYRVRARAKSGYSAYSNTNSATTLSAPVIVRQPVSQSALAGADVSFSVEARGTAPLAYEWQFQGVRLAAGTQYGGLDGPACFLTNVQPANAGAYTVVVTNEYGLVSSAVATLAVQVPGECQPAPRDLLGWWPAEGAANDLVGSADGLLQDGAVANAPGLVGQAFKFDGVGYVEIPDSPALRPNTFTLETWVKFDDLEAAGTAAAGQQYLVFKQNTRSSYFEGYYLGKERTAGKDAFACAVSSAGGQVVALASASLVRTGVWYHVAAVRGPDFVQLFVNGQLERTAPVSFAQDYGNHPLFLGTSGQSNWDGKFKGCLDEVSLYNRALSGAEIGALYTAGAAGKCKGLWPPSITAQPQSQIVLAGGNVQFSASAAGSAPLSYRWQYQGMDLFDGDNISGAASPTLNLANVQSANGGLYRVVVTNSVGAVTSAVATLTVGVPGECTAAPAGLVGWWAGDGSANDLLGNHHGRLQGGAVADVPGFVGAAFSFDGTNGYVEIPDAPELRPSQLTVEAWVRFKAYQSPGTSAYPYQQYIVFKQNSQSYEFEGFALTKDHDPQGEVILWEVASPAGQLIRLDSVNTVVTNEWYHVAGVRGSNYTQLYLNGHLEAQATVNFPQDYGNHPLYLGTSGQAYYDRKLHGDLDEVCLYNRALSGDEIAAIYAAGAPGKCKPVSGAQFSSPSVAGSPGRLVAPELLQDQLRLTLTGQAGRVYRIEVSSDLVKWTELQTVTITEGNARVSVPRNGSAQFYRARLLAE